MSYKYKPWIEIEKDDFEELFYSNTATEIGNMFGVSRITINKLAKKFGLKKGKGYHQRKVHANQ